MKSNDEECKPSLITDITHNKILDFFQVYAGTINAVNLELISTAKQLKKSQPKIPGSITLEFSTCSTQTEKLCIGCPHPRWKVWVDPRKKNPTFRSFAAKPIKYPLKSLKKSGHFESSFDVSRQLIKKASRLIEIREKTIAQLKNIRTSYARINLDILFTSE